MGGGNCRIYIGSIQIQKNLFFFRLKISIFIKQLIKTLGSKGILPFIGDHINLRHSLFIFSLAVKVNSTFLIFGTIRIQWE